MPNVDPRSEAELRRLFQNARDLSSGRIRRPNSTDPRGQHYVSFITPGRLIALFPGTPPAGPNAIASIASIERIVPRNPPKVIVGIGDTDISLPPKLPEVGAKIPFFGYLIGFAYLGHTVILFEGDQSALAIALRDADRVLVDYDVMPTLPDGWLDTAKREMRSFEVHVWNRDHPGSPVSQLLTSDQLNTKSYAPVTSAADQLARADARAVRGDYQGALDDLNMLIRDHPFNTSAYLKRAKLRQATGNTVSALSDLDQVVKIDPQNVAAYGERGAIYYASENWTQAVLNFNKVLEQLPTNYPCLQRRSEAYLYLKRFDLAVNDATALVRAYPKQAEPYNIRANALRSKGDYNAVIGDCNKAIQIDPNFYFAWINRSLAKRFKRDYTGAIADATKALEIVEALKAAGKLSESEHTQGYFSALGARDGALEDKDKQGRR